MSIPLWLRTLSQTSRVLPLKTRKKMLPWIVDKLKDTGMIESLVGENLAKASGFMAEFLSGSGKPRVLNISDKDWNKIIKESIEGRWTPSTNPKFHSKEGWEWQQIFPSFKGGSGILPGGAAAEEKGISNSLYNVLGSTTTLRRRHLGKGKYEYQIAEDFDLSEGKGGGWRSKDKGYQYYGGSYSRALPSSVAKLITTVFPEYTEQYDHGEGRVGVQTIRQFGDIRSNVSPGKPVPIISKYIHSTKIEDKLVDRFKNDENFDPFSFSIVDGY